MRIKGFAIYRLSFFPIVEISDAELWPGSYPDSLPGLTWVALWARFRKISFTESRFLPLGRWWWLNLMLLWWLAIFWVNKLSIKNGQKDDSTSRPPKLLNFSYCCISFFWYLMFLSFNCQKSSLLGKIICESFIFSIKSNNLLK